MRRIKKNSRNSSKYVQKTPFSGLFLVANRPTFCCVHFGISFILADSKPIFKKNKKDVCMDIQKIFVSLGLAAKQEKAGLLGGT